jgi:hypothetical protein
MLDSQIAWRQHDGGHTDGPNWKYFIPWADRQLKRVKARNKVSASLRRTSVPQRFVAVQNPNPSPQPGYSAKTTPPSAVVFDLKKPWI